MKSKLFSDIELAYGLIKRMNGYHFSHTGDQELTRLGYMISTNPKVKPYITASGKKFLMDVIGPIAEPVKREIKPAQPDKLKHAADLIKQLSNKKPSSKFFRDVENTEDEDDDEDDEIETKKKDKKDKK